MPGRDNALLPITELLNCYLINNRMSTIAKYRYINMKFL